MIFSYLDDSADTRKEHYYATGGLVASEEQWRGFAIQAEDNKSRGHAAVSSSFLAQSPDDEIFKWARNEAGAVRTVAEREWAFRTLDRQAGRMGGAEQPGDVFRGREEEQIIENMAFALGVDLTDPRDEMGQLVRLGIADMNPGRVLKNCEHLFVSLGARGFFSELLGLPTMGQKVVHCPLHNYSMRGMSLDVTYGSFKHRYCDDCPDASPRAPDWEYTPEWQQVENERHREYMEHSAGFSRRSFPLPPLPPDVQRQINPDADTQSG
jgi:hypothetical protein